MKSVVFSEPIIYVSLSLIILVLGTGLAFITRSVIPLLIVGAPLGWLLANVAEEELLTGKKWFFSIIVVFCIASILAFLYDYKDIGYGMIFGIILVSCSIGTLYKASYKKRGRK